METGCKSHRIRKLHDKDGNNHIGIRFGHLQGARTDRPGTGRNDCPVYRQGGEAAQSPREGDAAADHRAYMDKGGSRSHDRFPAAVQRLSRLVPLGNQLCGTDIRLLPRDRQADGEHGKPEPPAGEITRERACRGTHATPKLDIPGTDTRRHRHRERHKAGMPLGHEDD